MKVKVKGESLWGRNGFSTFRVQFRRLPTPIPMTPSGLCLQNDAIHVCCVAPHGIQRFISMGVPCYICCFAVWGKAGRKGTDTRIPRKIKIIIHTFDAHMHADSSIKSLTKPSAFEAPACSFPAPDARHKRMPDNSECTFLAQRQKGLSRRKYT